MAETIQEERWRWIRPIMKKEMRLVEVAKICPHGKRSLERWIAAFRKKGRKGLIPRDRCLNQEKR